MPIHLHRVAVCLALLVTACDEAPTAGCTPGVSAACTCTDGRTGAQVCDSSGAFGACVCEADEDAGTPADAGPGDDAGMDADGGLDAGPPSPLRVFVSRLRYRATAAPTACQNAADAAGLGGTWVPWLSFRSSTGTRDALDEISSEGPWELVTGEQAFANRAQLGTVPSVPINIAEDASTVVDGIVWTGTLLGGTAADDTCEGWTENGAAFVATMGGTLGTDDWTDGGTLSCDDMFHVFCFEL